MENKRLLKILLTNDDSIKSDLLYSLALSLSEIASVFVVAPETEQSGVSHAFTSRAGLILKRTDEQKFASYSLSGTPSDCIKFAISQNLCDSRPDLIFSGINFGENAGVSSLYSGTVAGAREGALWNIPSIALSLTDKKSHLKTALTFAKEIVLNRYFESMTPFTFWNVNFPSESVPFQGITLAKMSVSMFSDHYEKKETLYFLDGVKNLKNANPETDDFLLASGFATIVPHKIDQTSLTESERIKQLNFKLSKKDS